MFFASGEKTTPGAEGVSSSSSPKTFTSMSAGSFVLTDRPTLNSVSSCGNRIDVATDEVITGASVSPLKHVIVVPVNGNVSTTVQKFIVPFCCTPSLNWKLTLPPGSSGEPTVTPVPSRLLLKPPPLGCDGGSCRFVPLMLAIPPPEIVTVVEPESLGLRSAAPDGDGNVVKSMMRKRRRVRFTPVLFVNFRRKVTVPKVALLP